MSIKIHDDKLDMLGLASGGTPDAGYGRLYVKTDKSIHFVDDTGLDTNLLSQALISSFQGLMAQDEGINLATGTILNVVGSRLVASVSGTVIQILSSPDPAPQIGIMGRDEGTNLATGTILNFQGSGVTASMSGTVLNANIPGNWAASIMMGDGSGTFPVGNQVPVFELPFDCIIEQWDLMADITGSIQLRMKFGTYATYPPSTTVFSPSLSNQRKNQATVVVTGSSGDVIQTYIETISTLKQATLVLRGRRNIT